TRLWEVGADQQALPRLVCPAADVADELPVDLRGVVLADEPAADVALGVEPGVTAARVHLPHRLEPPAAPIDAALLTEGLAFPLALPARARLPFFPASARPPHDCYRPCGLLDAVHAPPGRPGCRVLGHSNHRPHARQAVDDPTGLSAGPRRGLPHIYF